MAPPRPGTVAPGAHGTMNSATANGDDRDPEIELFVKVGRVPGRRCTCSYGWTHVPGADRTGDAEPSPGRTAQGPAARSGEWGRLSGDQCVVSGFLDSLEWRTL